MAEIIGLGSLLADQILLVGDPFIRHLGGKKGGMEYTQPTVIKQLIERSGSQPFLTPGGSTANVIRGLAQFNQECLLITKVADDSLGRELSNHLRSMGISVFSLPPAIQQTGQVLSIVTPDGQRTMRTFIEDSAVWVSKNLKKDLFKNARLFHTEGYMLPYSDLMKWAMMEAKSAGALISLNLSSFEITDRYKKEIILLITEFLDILVANEEESHALTGMDPKRSCNFLKDICRTVIVTLGSQGCWVGHEGSLFQCPAYPVTPLDTTGAGDVFTSGFLNGYLRGLSIPDCAHFGALAAREVVQQLGSSLSQDQWQKLKQLYQSFNINHPEPTETA